MFFFQPVVRLFQNYIRSHSFRLGIMAWYFGDVLWKNLQAICPTIWFQFGSQPAVAVSMFFIDILTGMAQHATWRFCLYRIRPFISMFNKNGNWLAFNSRFSVIQSLLLIFSVLLLINRMFINLYRLVFGESYVHIGCIKTKTKDYIYQLGVRLRGDDPTLICPRYGRTPYPLVFNGFQ